jgi:hypothetical protein
MFPVTQEPCESSPSTSLDDLQPSTHIVRRGECCPRCGLGKLDYNGLLDLECPVCGYSEGLGGSCT